MDDPDQHMTKLALIAAKMVKHPSFGLDLPSDVRTSLRILADEYEHMVRKHGPEISVRAGTGEIA